MHRAASPLPPPVVSTYLFPLPHGIVKFQQFIPLRKVAQSVVCPYSYNNICHLFCILTKNTTISTKKKTKSIHIAQLNKESLATLSRPSGVAKQQTSHPRGAFFTFSFTL
jgi:hypothetical protein